MKLDFNDYFVYDSTSTSGLRWRIFMGSRAKKGAIAGCKTPQGYWVVELFNQTYVTSRVIYSMLTGDYKLKGYVVDHIDGNKDNNVAFNLRKVTQGVNCKNKVMSAKNKSGVVGVYRVDKKINGKFYSSWVAIWSDEFKTHKSRNLSINKYGEEGAKLLATLVRQTQIRILNNLGMGYTDRHGTIQ